MQDFLDVKLDERDPFIVYKRIWHSMYFSITAYLFIYNRK